jgi:hypothetical protein
MTTKKEAPKKSGNFVTMTNNDLLRIVSSGGLTALNNRELPATPTYWIGVITEHVERKWKKYSEAREKIVKQFAEKDENGEMKYSDTQKTNAKIPEDQMEAFTKEMTDLGEQEIEFTMKVRDSTLLSLAEQLEEKGINLKPLELSALRKFYQE